MSIPAESGSNENQERQFRFDELFFSRTDEHGIIRFGNDVFQRISDYGWDELIGKPHKIIRHPDMPRAAFKLLWDHLKRREPVAAYVKNRAKDGRHYWVLAVVTPVEGGYLSVRLRPSSALFEAAKTIYADLIAMERAQKLQPEESVTVLLEMLRTAGFDSYAAFMATAVQMEASERDRALRRPADSVGATLVELEHGAKDIIEQVAAVSEAYTRTEYVPKNFQVLAAQIGQEGKSIGIVSANYSVLSAEIRRSLDVFGERAGSMLKTIREGQFLTGTARLQLEMSALFAAETPDQEHAPAKERELLDHQAREYRTLALAGLNRIAAEAAQFQTVCTEMRRLASGLEVTRVMGKVECARHTAFGPQLNELLSDLDAFQKVIVAGLKNMTAHNNHIEVSSRRLIELHAA